jgi:hypothetical protein
MFRNYARGFRKLDAISRRSWGALMVTSEQETRGLQKLVINHTIAQINNGEIHGLR